MSLQTELNQISETLDSKFFKALSEPVRIEILKLLIVAGEADINSLAEKMPQDRSVISRHLNQMLDVGLLESRKDGRHVYYRVHGKAFLTKIEALYLAIKNCVAKRCC